MGHANETSNYELPQFVGTDKPTWLGDINGAMLKIDNAIAGVASDATSAVSVANGAATLATSASEAASTATATAEAASTAASGAASVANTAADTANNAQSTAVLAKSTADAAAEDAADALAAAVRGSVQVTGDGVKTISALLSELLILVDLTKIGAHSKLIYAGDYYSIVKKSTSLEFTRTYVEETQVVVVTFKLDSTSHYYAASITTSGTTINNFDSTVVTSGRTIEIAY